MLSLIGNDRVSNFFPRNKILPRAQHFRWSRRQCHKFLDMKYPGGIWMGKGSHQVCQISGRKLEWKLNGGSKLFYLCAISSMAGTTGLKKMFHFGPGLRRNRDESFSAFRHE